MRGGAAGFKGKASATAGDTGFRIGVTPTLVAGQEVHTVYALQGNGIDRADTAGCNGCGWRVDEMYTLNTIDRPAIVFDCRNMYGNEELSATLQAKPNGGYSLNCQNPVVYPNTARSLTARHDSSPCVDRGQNVIVYSQTGFAGYDEGCGTLRANGGDVGGVLRVSSLSVFENHSQDTRYTGPVDISQTVSATFGMGGNNTPFVVEKHE